MIGGFNVNDLSLSPGAQAARGMAALQPLTPPPMSRLQKKYETGLLIEAPNQAISASLRRVMPRSRLDARMYAASPG